MECSDTGASPAGEAGRVAVAGGAGKRETNASSQLTAPEASERRETKELCPMDTAESTGARETIVPEERSAAVRRDGEPLTSEAKRRRQTESKTDAEAPRTDAGERPPSPTREDEEEPPPLGEDPAGQEIPTAAITGREGGVHENSESIKRFEEIQARGSEKDAHRVSQGRNGVSIGVYGEMSRPGGQYERRGFSNSRHPTR